MSKAWKAHELRVAKRLGGERAGAVGKEGPDVLHPTLAPEIKERKRPLKTLQKYMAQAVRNAPAGRVPIVWLHTLGELDNDDLVVMRVLDWEQFWRAWEGQHTP